MFHRGGGLITCGAHCRLTLIYFNKQALFHLSCLLCPQYSNSSQTADTAQSPISSKHFGKTPEAGMQLMCVLYCKYRKTKVLKFNAMKLKKSMIFNSITSYGLKQLNIKHEISRKTSCQLNANQTSLFLQENNTDMWRVQ